MNPENDPGVAQLLDRALPHDPADPHGLVRAGMTRGRALRRRQRAGTAVAALAVFGVIGGVAAVVPFGSGGDTATPVASGGASSASDPTQSPSQSPSASPTTPFVPTAITIKARAIPAAVEQILGRQGASGPLMNPPYGVRDTDDEVLAHFRWQGALTSVIIEKKPGTNPQQQCASGADATDGTCSTTAAGDVELTWGPTVGDRVAAQGVTVWRGDFEVSTLSYNAADGKNSPQLTPEPPLTFDDLTAVATSDAWFD